MSFYSSAVTFSLKNRTDSMIIHHDDPSKPAGRFLTLTAFTKQFFRASNSLAHRSFCSSCLPAVVAATHFPYAAACNTTVYKPDLTHFSTLEIKFDKFYSFSLIIFTTLIIILFCSFKNVKFTLLQNLYVKL